MHTHDEKSKTNCERINPEAVPGLLEMLQYAYNVLVSGEAIHRNGAHLSKSEVIQMARAAIAKAESK